MGKSKSGWPLFFVIAGIVAMVPVLIAGSAEAQSFAYVTNNTSPPNNIKVIDIDPNSPGFNTVVGSITVGNSPVEVAVTPDGTRAYVANFNTDTVSVIDTATNTASTSITVGDAPFGVAITPDGSRAYVTNQFSDDVSVIDTDPNSATFNAQITIIPVGDSPNDVAITPDGSRAYVTNTTPVNVLGTISVIDTDPTSATFNIVIATITQDVGIDPRGIAITPDGTRAYFSNDTGGTGVRMIDTDPDSVDFNKVVDAIASSGSGERIAITPDGTRAYVTFRSLSCEVNPDQFSWCVRVVDIDPGSPNFNTVVAEVPVGNRPQDLAITPDGTRAYAAIRVDGDVSVIDTDPSSPNFNTIVANIPTGGGALFGVGFAPALNVAIDIKPGSFPNSINLGTGGNVPVAIFSTANFDATTVDPLTVTLASAPVKLKGNGTPQTSFEDVDGDGLLDQVVHVDTTALELSETDEEAVLTGKTTTGKSIRGMDTVRVVP